MSKYALFNAFANGLPITLLRHDGSVLVHASRIYGVRVESGYGRGQSPSCFLVTCWIDSTHERVDDVYVRTMD